MAEHQSVWHYLPLLFVLAAAGAYGSAVVRLSRRGDRWPVPSRWWFAVGVACVLITTGYPPLADPTGFEQHTIAHLIDMMVAPVAFALGAPVTLWLRVSGSGLRRKTLRLLHSRAAGMVALPPVVVLLDVSGMWAYYLTPLFGATEQHAPLHFLVHLHMFLTGCLLSWFVLGRDPGPRRGGLVAQLSVLFVAAAAHDVMAKVMYARLLPSGAGTAQHVQAGAQILYYGGDAIELLTAAVVMISWYRRGSREMSRARRRVTASPHGAPVRGN